METGYLALAFAAGTMLGFVIAWMLAAQRWRGEMARSMEAMKDAFGNLSFQALQATSAELTAATGRMMEAGREATVKELETKKQLVDGQLQNMNTVLKDAVELMKQLETDRAKKFGEVSQQLKGVSEQGAALAQETGRLARVFGSGQARGQWGEFMAEDLLQAIGMQEGVNYRCQNTMDESQSRPDFTFLLPEGKVLNMDVKFPLANYLRHVESDDDAVRAGHLTAFAKDVRLRVRELTGRGYISGTEQTLDFMLLFIPSEGIYRVMVEADDELLSYAIGHRVVLCSPSILFAILSVVRQATELFSIHERSAEVLDLMARFHKQWEKFIERFDSLGKKVEDVRKEYDYLLGTRRNQMDRTFAKMADLQSGLGEPEPD